VLLVGAGEMIELARPTSPRSSRAAWRWRNRTLDRAESLARRFKRRVDRLADLRALAGIRHYHFLYRELAAIIGKLHMERTVRAPATVRYSWWISRSPATSKPRWSGMDDVFLYTIDDSPRRCGEGVDSRQSARRAGRGDIESQSGPSCTG